ncbi:flagellar hook protein FlgE [Acidocella sp.]|jgi:flagellar hook protein FlgE|uniref:flagellar hook protein FlgE n=1 Tax=Acidocella sp. TaxID=50710 RepID=UPI002F4101A6
MSLQTALTGLNGAQTGLDTVSNDLANASTTAFKSQTAEFADIYPSGSSNVPGLGVTTSSMDTDFAQGAPVSTGNPFDAAIQGNGFFVVDQGGTQEYTRDGSFELNDSDELVSAATGAQVMGIQANGALGPITVNTGAMPATATTGLGLAFNLDSSTAMPTNPTFSPADATSYADTYPVTTYDSLGNANTVQLYFQPTTASAGAALSYNVYTQTPAQAAAATAATAAGTTLGSPADYSALTTLNFNSSGALVPAPTPPATTPTSGSPATLTVAGWGDGAAASTINFDFTGTTLASQSFALAGQTTPTGFTAGYPPGNYSGTTISSTGELVSTYSNGQSQDSGTLAIANFINQQGLTPLSGNLYASSTSSGQPVIDAPGTGQAGSVNGGELEQSNASTSELLVSLIEYQQAYQANASVIQTEQTDSTRLTQI